MHFLPVQLLRRAIMGGPRPGSVNCNKNTLILVSTFVQFLPPSFRISHSATRWFRPTFTSSREGLINTNFRFHFQSTYSSTLKVYFKATPRIVIAAKKCSCTCIPQSPAALHAAVPLPILPPCPPPTTTRPVLANSHRKNRQCYNYSMNNVKKRMSQFSSICEDI